MTVRNIKYPLSIGEAEYGVRLRSSAGGSTT